MTPDIEAAMIRVAKAALEHLAKCFTGDSNLNQVICCNGQDCGCQGATAESYVLHRITEADPAAIVAKMKEAEG